MMLLAALRDDCPDADVPSNVMHLPIILRMSKTFSIRLKV
jgi:hypothetical protein